MRRSALMKPSMKPVSISAPRPAGQSRAREATRAGWWSAAGGHSTAQRMADQMGLGDIERVEEIDDRLGQRLEIARPDILAASPWPGRSSA